MYRLISLTILFSLAFSLRCTAEKTITLRVNDAYAPFEYINKEGVPSGFTIDIFNAINDIEKFNFVIKPNKRIFNFFSTVIDSTELATSIDSLPTDNSFIASRPYGYVDNDVITRLNSDINGWDDMHGKLVLIEKDSPLIYIAKQRGINAEFLFIRNVPDGLRMLSSGKYDAMITSNDAAYFYINRLNLSNLSVKPLFCQPLPMRFVMRNTAENRKTIEHINNAIRIIKTSGVYDSIYSKRFFYNNEERDTPLDSESVFMIIIALLLVVAIILIYRLKLSNKRNLRNNITNLLSSPGDSMTVLSAKNQELQYRLDFLSDTIGYNFFEYSHSTGLFSIDNTSSVIDAATMNTIIHPSDRDKAFHIINDMVAGHSTDSHIVVRILSQSSHEYEYFSVNLKLHDSVTIFGAYCNITESTRHINSLEEFRESAILACEINQMGYFEYIISDKEHNFIPTIFTEKYGIDDNNFVQLMDDVSRAAFSDIINDFNACRHSFVNTTLRVKSPFTHTWAHLAFTIIPVSNDTTRSTYKYMGFIKDIINSHTAS